jgi:hypothetical protein
MYWEQRPNDAQPFRPSQCMPGFLYLDNHLISSLNNNSKRKETPENGYLDTSVQFVRASLSAKLVTNVFIFSILNESIINNFIILTELKKLPIKICE